MLGNGYDLLWYTCVCSLVCLSVHAISKLSIENRALETKGRRNPNNRIKHSCLSEIYLSFVTTSKKRLI